MAFYMKQCQVLPRAQGDRESAYLCGPCMLCKGKGNRMLKEN